MPLTEEQKEIIRSVVKNKDKDQIQTIGGYAGTGKSTIVNTLQVALPNFSICAYTGKAANVLRRKGIEKATTIHRAIYRPMKDLDGNTTWSLAYPEDLNDVGGFIVDEASMVSQEIDRDLQSFGKPIIYIGDHGQLEPIGGTKFNIMASPMYRLEQVHRNAGEIAHFAEHLRKGHIPRHFNGTKAVQVVKGSAVTPRHLSNTDQVICAFNRTRCELNQLVRNDRGIDLTYIAVGEKIMCLRNNRISRLFNGMQGIVKKIRPGKEDLKKFFFDFVSDGEYFANIQYDPDQFGKETNGFDFSSQAHPFDYAYAITCHKAQGDQWGNVMVYEQKCDKWDHRKWAYTAASRAKHGLVWVETASFIPDYLK